MRNVSGLQYPVLGQNLSFKVAEGEMVQILQEHTSEPLIVRRWWVFCCLPALSSSAGMLESSKTWTLAPQFIRRQFLGRDSFRWLGSVFRGNGSSWGEISDFSYPILDKWFVNVSDPIQCHFWVSKVQSCWDGYLFLQAFGYGSHSLGINNFFNGETWDLAATNFLR